MWTIISFIVLIAAIVVLAYYLFCFSEKIDNQKEQIEYHINSNQESINRSAKLSLIVRSLRSRVKTYSVGITRFKTPDTDIRVIQVYARDELAIELQKDGLITYKMSEHWREDLKETEVKVIASINVNKIK